MAKKATKQCWWAKALGTEVIFLITIVSGTLLMIFLNSNSILSVLSLVCFSVFLARRPIAQILNAQISYYWSKHLEKKNQLLDENMLENMNEIYQVIEEVGSDKEKELFALMKNDFAKVYKNKVMKDARFSIEAVRWRLIDIFQCITLLGYFLVLYCAPSELLFHSRVSIMPVLLLAILGVTMYYIVVLNNEDVRYFFRNGGWFVLVAVLLFIQSILYPDFGYEQICLHFFVFTLLTDFLDRKRNLVRVNQKTLKEKKDAHEKLNLILKCMTKPVYDKVVTIIEESAEQYL